MPSGRISPEKLDYLVHAIANEGGFSFNALQEPDRGTRIGYIVVDHKREARRFREEKPVVVSRESEPIVVIRDRGPRQVVLIYPTILREMIEPLLEKE